MYQSISFHNQTIENLKVVFIAEKTPWGGKHGWTCNSCAEIKANILKQERLEAVTENEYDEWDCYNESEMKCPHYATVFEQDGQEPDEKQE